VLTCSLRIDSLCGLPATRVLVVQEYGSMASAFPCCAIHDPAGYETLLSRTAPAAVVVILPVQLPVA
jgi:hypothetical protein